MSLEDKRQVAEYPKSDEFTYPEEDVKEFIKELKEEIQNTEELWAIPDEVLFKVIDNLAGKSLVEKK